MKFELQHNDTKSNARAGLITTDHGVIETPIFMPVGTQGTVKGVHMTELEEDIMPIDTLIGFAESEGGAQVFGADKAKDVAAHAREIKSAGAAYCDCPACVVVAEILEKKDMLL